MTPSLLEICDSTQWFRSIMSIRLAMAIYVEPENRKVSHTRLLSLLLLALPLVLNCCLKTEKGHKVS